MRKEIFGVFILLIILILIPEFIFSQNIIKKQPELAEKIREQLSLFNFEEEVIKEVIVYKFKGTTEEAFVFVENNLLEEGDKLSEMKFIKNNLCEILNFYKITAEKGYFKEFDQQWLESAKKIEAEIEDIKQISYYDILINKGEEIEISIESPFFNPFSLDLAEGTHIVFVIYQFEKSKITLN
jgi:hypothetical protein